MIRTFETVVRVTPKLGEHDASTEIIALNAYGDIAGRVQRKLFAELLKGRSWSCDLQKNFYQPFGITSTHLAHIHKDLCAKIDAAKACAADNAKNFAAKIAAKTKQIGKKESTLAKIDKVISAAKAKRSALNVTLAKNISLKSSVKSDLAIAKIRNKMIEIDAIISAVIVEHTKLRMELHQHKRRLGVLHDKLIIAEQRSLKASICFGTRELFGIQHNLRANDYASHNPWLTKWRNARSSQIFIEGNAAIKGGNEFVRANITPDGYIDVEIRLPPALKNLVNATTKRGLPIVQLRGLCFNHGHEAVIKALSGGLRGKDQRPVTWRMIRRDNGDWTISVMIHDETPAAIHDYGAGALGVDLNEYHAAVTLTSPDGNPLQSWNIPLCTHGKSSDQARDLTRKAVRQIVNLAKIHGVPIVSERLDFRGKKASLALDEGPRQARMLSAFAYSQFDEALHRAAVQSGVWHARVNPAFTSIIGRLKFARRYGLSIHAAAAHSIARRAMNLSERLPFSVDQEFSINAVGHVALAPLVKMERLQNSRRHVWSAWNKVARRLKPALAARSRDSFMARRLRRSAIKDGGDALGIEKVEFLSDAGPGLDQRDDLTVVGV